MNNILRRWHNIQTTWGRYKDMARIFRDDFFFVLIGYVELSYRFASFIAFGTYTIRCEAQQSSSEKSFLVDFFRKNFIILFSMPNRFSLRHFY